MSLSVNALIKTIIIFSLHTHLYIQTDVHFSAEPTKHVSYIMIII